MTLDGGGMRMSDQSRKWRWTVGAGWAVSLALVTLGVTSQAQTGSAPRNPFAQLQYRHIGPGGNRVAAVVGEPGNPMVIFAGASDGGIWKTTDGGINWKPVF